MFYLLPVENARRQFLRQSWNGDFILRNFFIQQVLSPGKVHLLKKTLAPKRRVSTFLLLHVFSPIHLNLNLNACLILIEIQDQQRPPDRLQQQEIVPIAEKIPRTWKKLAYLTKLFQSHEIDDITYSRVGEDESQKACTLLTRYMERGGTRQKLAHALEKLKMSSLAQDVLSGYYISD